MAFETEARALGEALGELARSIEPVGSTAVPGLAAKAVIDIQVPVRSLGPRQPYYEALAPLGYNHVYLGDFDLVYPYFEKPGARPHTHHLHLCEMGSEQERAHLAFRDYLRSHAEIAECYSELKRRLAAESDGLTLASRERYSLSKTQFVQGWSPGRCRKATLFQATDSGPPRACRGNGL